MRYDGLSAAYWQRQAERINTIREKINARESSAPGRVIPDSLDIVIGTGRVLDVAVMFLDISGFSSRPSGARVDQAVNVRVLALFFSEMVRIAEDYGGSVEKNTGDGLLVFFEDGGGDPPAEGTQRALACAMTMFAANDVYIRAILERSRIQPIEFRVSIDHGPVTIARLGAAKRFNSVVAVGSTANFASKMLANARAGEIVLGQNARSRVPSVWGHFVELAVLVTGWVHANTPMPYLLYRFTGRWQHLV